MSFWEEKGDWHRQKKKRQRDRRDWNDAAMSQGMPAATRSKAWFSPRVSRRSPWGSTNILIFGPVKQNSDFRIVASRTVRELMTVVLNHHVCSHLLQQL